MRDVVATFSAADLAQSLCGTAKAFLDLCSDLESKPLHRLLRTSGVRATNWNGVWSLADAAWLLVTRNHPKLRYYPLGETAERAIKKTVLDLLPKPDKTGPPDLMAIADQELTEELLRDSIKSLDKQGRLRRFLANYFFEMAIDYLRRPSKDPEQDSAFDYHFSREKRAVWAAKERKLRQSLAAQCDESAGQFLQFIKQSVDDPDTYVEAITRGMDNVFQARPLQSTRKASARKPLVNVVVGNWSLAKVEKSFKIDRSNLLWLVLEGKQRNVTLKLSAFEDYLGHPLHSLTKDLLQIGAAVYIADLYQKRSSNLSRQIGLLMRVRHPDVWTSAKPLLERAVTELGRDDFTFHFQKKKEKAQSRSRLKLNQKSERCVSLFSGGIDSLAGAVWALKHNLDPILVGHYAGNALSGIQTKLANAMGQLYQRDGSRVRARAAIKAMPGKAPIKPHARSANLNVTADVAPLPDFVHFSLHRTKQGKKAKKKHGYGPKSPADSIMLEHLRSLLFLSAACAIALETGNGTVYIFENGPVALNPLFSEGTVNTRTSHPHFINVFRRLINAVFNVELRIENPFLYKTKGEVVKILDEPKLRGLLAKSNSCWGYARVPLLARRLHLTWSGERHDGLCVPCIIRRTSVWAAGLQKFDATYLVDVFSRYPQKLDRQTIVSMANLLRFCGNVLKLDSQTLLSFAPDLSVYDDDIDAGLLGEMYHRHAAEVVCAFKALSNRRLRTDFKALLSFHC